MQQPQSLQKKIFLSLATMNVGEVGVRKRMKTCFSLTSQFLTPHGSGYSSIPYKLIKQQRQQLILHNRLLNDSLLYIFIEKSNFSLRRTANLINASEMTTRDIMLLLFIRVYQRNKNVYNTDFHRTFIVTDTFTYSFGKNKKDNIFLSV